MFYVSFDMFCTHVMDFLELINKYKYSETAVDISLYALKIAYGFLVSKKTREVMTGIKHRGENILCN
jgi:hypothetical protein